MINEVGEDFASAMRGAQGRTDDQLCQMLAEGRTARHERRNTEAHRAVMLEHFVITEAHFGVQPVRQIPGVGQARLRHGEFQTDLYEQQFAVRFESSPQWKCGVCLPIDAELAAQGPATVGEFKVETVPTKVLFKGVLNLLLVAAVHFECDLIYAAERK